MGLAAFRLIFEEVEEKNNVPLCFLSYLNETTESKYKYATTHEDQSLLNQFWQGVYISGFFRCRLNKASLVPHQAARQCHPFPSTLLFLPVECWRPPPGPNLEANRLEHS